MTNAARGERYFFIMAIVMMALVVGGFGLFGLRGYSDPLSLPLMIHFHGLVFLSWFALFGFQAFLIGKGNAALHMRLGQFSLALAFLMLVIGYLASRHAMARPAFSIAGFGPESSMIFPFTDLINFSICYGLALHHRRNAAAHKRLMLLAGILILDPALSRLMFGLGLPIPLSVLLFLGLLISLIVYDVKKLRRPHWTSVLGLALFIVAMVAKFTLAETPPWIGMAKVIFG